MTAASIRGADPSLDSWQQQALIFEKEVAKAVIGQERVIRLLTIAVFARGHVLLEGDVGVGKTTLLRAVARAIGGAYERVEGSVDLMPSDLIYYTYLNEEGRPKVDPGPVLRHGEDFSIFFFNEINRARPQVHSLLLRLMAERSANAFNRDYNFPYLQVFADRNRIEKEETFELPAAARDRFFMEVGVKTPSDPQIRQELIFDPRFHDVDALVATVKEGVIDFRAIAGDRSRHSERRSRQPDAPEIRARPLVGYTGAGVFWCLVARSRHGAADPWWRQPARLELPGPWRPRQCLVEWPRRCRAGRHPLAFPGSHRASHLPRSRL